jgi:hypothetical protein
MSEEVLNYANEYLKYDPDGSLRWAKRAKHSSVCVGQMVGHLDKDGYRRFALKGKLYRASRIIWLMHYGEWPRGHIDHINNDVSDNRIENLRDVTNQQNCFNRKLSRSNTSGYKGVAYHKNDKKWQASIQLNGKTKFLGYFDDPQKAHLAYCEAAKNLFGQYANNGITTKGDHDGRETKTDHHDQRR